MKAKVFNKTSSAALSAKDLTPIMSINPKSGLISFSKGFNVKSGITVKNRVNIIQDEEKPKNWYIQVTDEKDKEAFSVREKNHYVSFNNTAITREIIRSCELEEASHRFILAAEPEKTELGKLWPIITKSGKTFHVKKK